MRMNEKIAELLGLTKLNEMDDKHCRFLYSQAEKEKKGSEEREKNVIQLFKAMGIDKLNPDQQADLRTKIEALLDTGNNVSDSMKMDISNFKWNNYSTPVKPITEKVDPKQFKWTDATNVDRMTKQNQEFDLIQRVKLEPKSVLIDPVSNKVVQSTYKSLAVGQILTPELITSLKRRGVQIKHIEV